MIGASIRAKYRSVITTWTNVTLPTAYGHSILNCPHYHDRWHRICACSIYEQCYKCWRGSRRLSFVRNSFWWRCTCTSWAHIPSSTTISIIFACSSKSSFKSNTTVAHGLFLLMVAFVELLSICNLSGADGPVQIFLERSSGLDNWQVWSHKQFTRVSAKVEKNVSSSLHAFLQRSGMWIFKTV